jgi:hypothetical protein
MAIAPPVAVAAVMPSPQAMSFAPAALSDGVQENCACAVE